MAVTAAMEAVEALEHPRSSSMSSQQALPRASSKKQYPVAPALVAPVEKAAKAGMDAFSYSTEVMTWQTK